MNGYVRLRIVRTPENRYSICMYDVSQNRRFRTFGELSIGRTHGVSPTTRETADARVWSQRVTTRQDRHNNLCHQPPPRKDRASLRRRRRTRISTFRAKFTRPSVFPRSLFAYLAYTIGHYVPSLLTRRARVLHNWRRSRYHPIFSACSLLT